MSGESEARIRELFQAASDSAPAIIFLDELDSIAPKRNDGKGMEKRMVAQLLTCLDMLQPKYNRQMAPVIVMGATNRPDAIDPALRRAGRFDKEILMGVPDEEARIGILKTITKNMKVSGDFDLKALARQTPGYVGADVKSLTKEAAVIAINRIFKNVLVDQKLPSDMIDEDDDNPPPVAPLTAQEMESLYITMQDFLDAVPKVQPSSKREGFATVPGVSWDDIGALGSVREELTLSVLEPIRNPEKFKALGIPLPAGVLLYGPPGCGKTLLAKAIANESGANFISVKGPELLDKYVGESERSVRLVFERARASSPCVVFFDELDSLCPKRGGDSSGGGVSERVVNQLLTEMDGLESRRSVFVIAATNRPELIDPAMMRPYVFLFANLLLCESLYGLFFIIPDIFLMRIIFLIHRGRLDKLLYVSLPTPEDRVSILKAISTNIKFSPDVDLHKIGTSPNAEGYSGADCSALLREAGLAVLKESYENDISTKDPNQSDTDLKAKIDESLSGLCIRPHHFDYAFAHVVPSVSQKDQARYHRIRDRMAHARSRGALLTETAKDGEDGEKESNSSNINSAGTEP
jgi:ribosome biogenesis ATPase